MKRQIRFGVFETNSSLVHNITMCSKNDFQKWIDGEFVWDRWSECFINADDERVQKDDEKRYLTYEQFHDWDYLEYETFKKTYITESGDKVVAFGYYGHD